MGNVRGRGDGSRNPADEKGNRQPADEEKMFFCGALNLTG